MKEILILSGKGGTGKTTVAAAFIALSKTCAFADCDVDVPNLHLIFNKETPLFKEDYVGYRKAVIDQDLCTHCGICQAHCAFGALKNGVINTYLCEGCGVCELVCPVSLSGGKAVRLEEVPSGACSVWKEEEGTFSTALLSAGSRGTGKLVSRVKRNLAQYAQEEVAIVDGAPGMGCPIVASVAGADLVLLVVEPSLSGISDLERVLETVSIFGTEALVCINKVDSCQECAARMREFCAERGIAIVGEIPYDPLVLRAVNHSRPVTHYEDSPAAIAIGEIYLQVMSHLNLLDLQEESRG